MRLLSLGFPLPDPQVDNHTFLNAPSLFDYDTVLVDPSALSEAIEEVLAQTGEATSAAGQPVVNGPTGPLAAGLADLLRGRLAEVERLLARGGLVLVIGHPNVAHHQVAGFAGADRYFWLPAPAGLAWGPPDLVMGAGQGAVLTEQAHPFANYIDAYRSRITYRAYFTEGAAFGRGARVFARSHGGAAIGVEFALGDGRIVFLPAPDVPPGMERHDLATCLLDGVRRALEMPPDEEPPAWVRSHALPGLEQREAAQVEAERALAEAEARLAEATAATEALARYRRLLWQEGKHALEPVVLDALRLLGFEPRDEPGRPAVLVADGAELFVEVEGAPGPVDMAPHYRLRERRERALVENGALPPGLLIVNGQRLTPPEDRDAQYVDALRIAGESMGYGILTTVQLFDLAQRALAGADESWRAGARRRLAGAQGPVTVEMESANGTPATEDIPSRPTTAH